MGLPILSIVIELALEGITLAPSVAETRSIPICQKRVDRAFYL